MLLVITLAGFGACTGPDSSCDEVRANLQGSIGSLCGQAPYNVSPFCKTCIGAGYYAISDSCVCRRSILNTDYCYAPDESTGMGAVENAVQQANQTCPSPTLPYRDAGSDATHADGGGSSSEGGGGGVDAALDATAG